MSTKAEERSRKRRVTVLKKRAKNAYLAYHQLLDRCDAGIALADVISGGKVTSLAAEFNQAMDELAKLGEPVPTARLGPTAEA